ACFVPGPLCMRPRLDDVVRRGAQVGDAVLAEEVEHALQHANRCLDRATLRIEQIRPARREVRSKQLVGRVEQVDLDAHPRSASPANMAAPTMPALFRKWAGTMGAFALR